MSSVLGRMVRSVRGRSLVSRPSIVGQPMPRVSPFREAGVSGVQITAGFVRSIERNTDWIGQKKYQTISEIVSNVSIVAASVHYFINLISHPNWKVVPASDEQEAKDMAEFMESVMKGMTTPWQRVVRRAGMYRFQGFGVQEWTAKKRKEDGKIGMLDVESRPQFTIERWEVDDDGTVTGMWQRSPQTGQLLAIPRKKTIYLVDDTLSDSPEGMGLYRHMAEPYSRLKQYLALEMRAYERDLRGVPIARAPLTLLKSAVQAGRLTQTEADQIVAGMQDFVKTEVKQSNTGVLLDSMPYEYQDNAGNKFASVMQWGLELLTGTGAGLTDMAHAIDRLQREMARVLGTEQLMMGGQDSGGNRALSQDKSRNLYLNANSVNSNIASQMDKDFIDPTWTLNGFDEKLKPKFAVEDVAFKDAQEVTAALRDMATAGAVLTPDDPVIDDVRDLLGVSRQPERNENEMDQMLRGKPPIENFEEDERQQQRDDAEFQADLQQRSSMTQRAAKAFIGWTRKLGVFKEVRKAWDESKHPRVPPGSPDGGQFTSADGAGDEDDPARARSAVDLFNQTYDPSVTVDDVIARSGVAQKIREAEEKLAAGGMSTHAQYMTSAGMYTEERRAVQDQVLAKFITPEVVDRATVPAGQQPVATFLGGRGGSGKSWFTGDAGPRANKDYFYINSDDFKEKMPEYKGWNAALLHDEVDYLVDRANTIARRGRMNVVLDATMRSRRTVERMIDDYKAAGYRIEGYFMHTSPQEAAMRAMRRFNRSNRYVPPAYILGSTTNEKSFDEMTPKMDHWEVYDNNSGTPRRVLGKGKR